MRSQTGLQIKHNERLLEHMKAEVDDGRELIKDIEAQRVLIRKVNF